MDAVARALARLGEVDGWLRAFVEVTADAALRDAAAIDARVAAGPPVGPLAGVPIAVKPERGGLQRERLRAAGAVPIGVTSTPRGPGPQTWGHTERGPTRNPWRGDLSPGGSSAGSAAAVAAGIVALATGSDGAGSSRIPAAWCGVLGYKPTTALAPGGGRAGLTVPAPLARHAVDLAAWADAVLGPLPPAPAPRRVTWSADLGYASAVLDEECVAIARAAADDLAARAGLDRADGCVVGLRDPASAWTALRSAHSSPARIAAAIALRVHNDRRLAALFTDVDLLLTPTTPGPPHGHDGPGSRMSVALTWAFNLSGHPAVSIAAGRTRAGAPVGLQLVARPGADRALLDLVRAALDVPGT